MDTSTITESEASTLFDKDGDLRDTPQTSEDSGSDGGNETPDTSGEEPQKGDEASLDWSKLDASYKNAWEKTQSEAQKWKNDYAKIQSHLTKQSNSRKELEANLAELRTRNDVLGRWEKLLESNPRLQDIIKSELARANDPFNNISVPDDLRQNPAFKYIQETMSPYVRGLEEKIQLLEQKTGKLDQWEQGAVRQQAKNHLDGQLEAAKAEIKTYLGREATDEDMTRVLQYMVDKKFYEDGATAALRVFKDQFRDAVLRSHDEQMKEKAKKFPPKNKSVNSARAADTSNKASSVEDAIALAFAEQGLNV